jgi:O-antigen chain-terminating methyltransferase
VKIIDVMQQVREETKHRHESAASAYNGTALTVESTWSLPAPATLHVTALKEDAAEKFWEAQRRAQEKTEVNRYIPKFLRRLFRHQGGFNIQVLEVTKLLMKESRGAHKRLREIIAYLQAEKGWFDGVMAAFAHIQRTLERRLDNQYSLEARLLALDNKVAEARSEFLQKLQRLEENSQALASALDEEKNARCRTDRQLGTANDALTGVRERVNGQDVRLESLSSDLEVVRVTLAGEAKARDGFLNRLDATHQGLLAEAKAREDLGTRLDATHQTLVAEAKAREEVGNGLDATHQALLAEAKAREDLGTRLDATHQALVAEAKAREHLGTRLDGYHNTIPSLSLVNELSEAVGSAKRENDRLTHDIQAIKAAFGSLHDLLTRVEERQVSDASYLKRELYIHSQTLGTLHASARPTRGGKGATALPVVAGSIKQNQFDSFYLAFENQFRGTRAAIKQRIQVYVPFLKSAGVGKRKTPVLDLGCGRGEWLELLRDEELVGRGIDSNEFMVSECVERKLKVTQADVIEHLGTLDSDSIGAITAFHLIEHLPFPILLKLFAESLRVLRPGGICIFETPNPDNLQVGSNRFYFDPTHLHPLPHAFTSFVMSTTGFKSVEILPLHPDENAVPLTDEANPVERFAHQMFFGAQDYSVIGRK